MKTFLVKVTHRDSTRELDQIFEVKAEPVIGALTGLPMYEFVEKINGRTEYIITKYCEKI